MAVSNYTDLRHHIGHEIECVCYSAEYEYENYPENVSIECLTCGMVLLSFDKEEEEKEDKKHET